MFGGADPSAGITVIVNGVNLSRDFNTDARTMYNVVGQTNGKTIYGVTHRGNNLGWKDVFAVNCRDLQYDDLDLITYVNDQQIGRGHLNIFEVMKLPEAVVSKQIQIRKQNDVVGYLQVQVNKSVKQQIVGGLRPPAVTLRTNPFDLDLPQHYGLQQNRANKLNLFSCMDAGDMGWEFMPYNFQTKMRERYDPINTRAGTRSTSNLIQQSNVQPLYQAQSTNIQGSNIRASTYQEFPPQTNSGVFIQPNQQLSTLRSQRVATISEYPNDGTLVPSGVMPSGGVLSGGVQPTQTYRTSSQVSGIY